MPAEAPSCRCCKYSENTAKLRYYITIVDSKILYTTLACHSIPTLAMESDALSPNSAASDKPAKKRGRPFQPGQSGNLNGRPKGSANQATILAQQLLEGEVEQVTRSMIERAKQGDSAAQRLFFERVVPARRSRAIHFDLPSELNSPADVLKASKDVNAACSRGELLTCEAAEVLSLLSAHAGLIASCDLKQQLEDLKDEIEPLLEEFYK
jgi:uncharacterized protein DUF5681